jgi:hypothetical protein
MPEMRHSSTLTFACRATLAAQTLAAAEIERFVSDLGNA